MARRIPGIPGTLSEILVFTVIRRAGVTVKDMCQTSFSQTTDSLSEGVKTWMKAQGFFASASYTTFCSMRHE